MSTFLTEAGVRSIKSSIGISYSFIGTKDIGPIDIQIGEARQAGVVALLQGYVKWNNLPWLFSVSIYEAGNTIMLNQSNRKMPQEFYEDLDLIVDGILRTFEPAIPYTFQVNEAQTEADEVPADLEWDL